MRLRQSCMCAFEGLEKVRHGVFICVGEMIGDQRCRSGSNFATAEQMKPVPDRRYHSGWQLLLDTLLLIALEGFHDGSTGKDACQQCI